MGKSYITGVRNRLIYYSEFRSDCHCWWWTGETIKGGYGLLKVSEKDAEIHKSSLAHRISYEVFIGPIPGGLTLDHLCRNPSCINPEHLEPVTLRVNIRRGKNANKTHCKYGHPYDEKNTYWMPNGGRDCKQCINRRSREYHLRKKARLAAT